MMVTTALLFAQLSAGAIVARTKEHEMKVEDFRAEARMEIFVDGGSKEREFVLELKRDGVDYRARVTLEAPRAMVGTKFLVRARRGKRNQEWAYFPDLDLVRAIPGKSQEDPFLGSHLTFADLAGGAHLDDLRHELIGEEEVGGEPCYVMEGVPRHGIAYGKLRGYVRQKDFVTVKAIFYDRESEPLKEVRLSEFEELEGGGTFARKIEIRSLVDEGRTVLSFSDVRANIGLPDDAFTEEAFSRQ